MGHILDLLHRHQIKDVVATLRFMAASIQDHFEDGSAFNINLSYSVEDAPLGTAGSVKNAASLLDSSFLVISGDALTDFDLSQVIRAHKAHEAKATIVLKRVPNPQEFGVVARDPEGWVTQLVEKPGWGEIVSDTVNTGIYVLEPEALDLIPAGTPFDFSLNLFPLMLQSGLPLFGYVADGYWCDIGTMGEYMRANADMLNGRVQTTESIGRNIGGGIWVGEDTEIAVGAQLFGPIYLGSGVKIKDNVRIYGPTVIRDYSVIDNHTLLERSILWRNNYIGENCEIRGAIIGRQCSVKSHVILFEGAVIGDGSVLGEKCIVRSDVKLWPNKEIETGADVRDSIIWGSHGRRALFGRFGATGVVNVDLTPEFVARLGAALGATLPKGSYVAVNRDAHRSSRMLKRALVSGLPASGVNVWDTEATAIPAFRHFVSSQPTVMAGVHIRLSPFDQRVVDIRVFDRDGLNMNVAGERAIERNFFREDFRRAFFNEIGFINMARSPQDAYVEDFLRQVNIDLIRKAKLRVVVDYSHGSAADALSSVLGQLAVDVVPLNARVDETKLAMLEKEFHYNQERVGKIVNAVDAHVGVQLDVGGEKTYIVSEKGEVLSDVTVAALMMELALFAHPNSVVAMPVTMPNAFETIAQWHQSRIVRITQYFQGGLIANEHEQILLAFDGAGNFVFPAFQPFADGMMATAKLLEYLAIRALPISEVIRYLPPIHMASAAVNCPWELKGAVMRRLSELYQDQILTNSDGVKINASDNVSDNAWVHFSLHPDKPQFNLVAESYSVEKAQELIARYKQSLEALIR
jgi:mannose-1-phosphate guanylyltransferase/phosphomannomutase